MVALDADGNGSVDKEEMDKAGVKVLVTDKDGNQAMKSLSEAFGDDDVNVDLNSYKEAGEGAKASNGQTLLGNFGINVGDKNYEGYSTLDSAEYLQDNYTFTDENPVNAGVDVAGTDNAKAKATNAADAKDAEVNADPTENQAITDDTDKFIEDYTAKLEAFNQQFEQITELLGLDEELIATINELGKAEGEAAANEIIKDAKAKEEKEIEKAEAEKAEEEEQKKEEEEQEAVAA